MTKKKINKKEALAKIETLFKYAKDIFKENKELANKNIKKARRIAMKFKLKIRPELKRKFCKFCHSYLIPGQNLRVRTQEGKLIYYCLECKKHWRMPYSAKKKKSL